MGQAETLAAELQAPPSVPPHADHERRCLVTGETLAKGHMVRFVVGPADQVVPDLSEDLPGRGLWVKADFEAINLAAHKGLFAKAAKMSARAAPDLAEQVIQLLHRRCLSFVGLAKGAGIAVLGEEQVGIALRANKLALLLLADDASANIGNRNDIAECRIFTRAELGASLGYAQIVYAGFKPHGLTKRLQAELNRLTQLIMTQHSKAPHGNG